MPGLTEMLGGVLMWAGIAATDMPAGQAHPQMCPGLLTVDRTFLALARGERRWIYDAYRGMKMVAAIRGRCGCFLGPTETLAHVDQG